MLTWWGFSAVQASLGMASQGGGFQIINGISIADDFEITEYTTATTITFFAYQTGGGIPSAINKVYFQIWDGDPSAGGSVIFGDLATNRLISTDWTNMYRASDENPEILTGLLWILLLMFPGSIFL